MQWLETHGQMLGTYRSQDVAYVVRLTDSGVETIDEVRSSGSSDPVLFTKGDDVLVAAISELGLEIASLGDPEPTLFGLPQPVWAGSQFAINGESGVEIFCSSGAQSSRVCFDGAVSEDIVRGPALVGVTNWGGLTVGVDHEGRLSTFEDGCWRREGSTTPPVPFAGGPCATADGRLFGLLHEGSGVRLAEFRGAWQPLSCFSNVPIDSPSLFTRADGTLYVAGRVEGVPSLWRLDGDVMVMVAWRRSSTTRRSNTRRAPAA